jgi:hypothetical protein
MKKLILVFAACLFFFTTEAQTEKGTIQIGVGGLPSVIYPGTSLLKGRSLRANVGYFFFDDFVVGVLPFRGRVREINSFGASLYARYYFIENDFSVFVEAGFGLGLLRDSNAGPWNDGILNPLNIGPGIHYRITDQVAIELLLQYARLRDLDEPTGSLIRNTFIPTIGIQYFIFDQG